MAGYPTRASPRRALLALREDHPELGAGTGDDAAVTGPTERSHLIEVGPFGYGIFRFNR